MIALSHLASRSRAVFSPYAQCLGQQAVEPELLCPALAFVVWGLLISANWKTFPPASWCWHEKEEVYECASKLCWSLVTQSLLQSFGFSHLLFLSVWYLQHPWLPPKAGNGHYLWDIDSLLKARGWELKKAFSLPVWRWQTWRPLVPSILLFLFYWLWFWSKH